MSDFNNKPSDDQVLPRLYQIYGVTNEADLLAAITSVRAAALQDGDSATDIPETDYILETQESVLGHDGDFKNWRFDIILNDGRTEVIYVRATNPREAISRIKNANTYDTGRRNRWNNNVQSVLATNVSDNDEPIEVDNYYFDRQVDVDELSLQYIQNVFPSRYNEYSGRAAGRYESPDTLMNEVNLDGSLDEIVENVYDDTEPAPRSTPSVITGDVPAATMLPNSDIDVSGVAELVSQIRDESS